MRWYIREGNLEPLLDILEDLLVVLVAHEGNGETLGTETTGTTDAVEVGVGIGGQIVVDGQVDTLDINTTAENVSGHTDTLVELLELLIAFDTGVLVSRVHAEEHTGHNLPLLLADTGVDSDAGEITLAQQLVELVGALGALDEDDDLVELQVVQQVVQLAVLLLLAQLDVVLLQTVKSELGVIVDVDLERVSHELLADGANLLGEGGAEHHNLLVGGGSTENLLDIAAHVYSKRVLDNANIATENLSWLTNLVEHLVTLIEDESLDVAQRELLITDQGVQTTGGGDDNVGVGLLVLEKLDVLLDGGTTVEDRGLDIGEVLGETSVLVLDLVG